MQFKVRPASRRYTTAPAPSAGLGTMVHETPQCWYPLHKGENYFLDVRWFLQGHTRSIVESKLKVWSVWLQKLVILLPEILIRWIRYPWTGLFQPSSLFSLPFRTMTYTFMNSLSPSVLPSPSTQFLSSCYPIPICNDFRTEDSLKCTHFNYA